jgi:hypothetical protein
MLTLVLFAQLAMMGHLHAQAVDPLPPAYVSVASEGTYQGTSPVVNLPAGTTYTFGLSTGVMCAPYTAAAPVAVVVYVSSFADCKSSVGVGDPDPGKIKNLYVLQTKGDQTGTYTVPPDPTVKNWKVPGYGGGTVTPPVIPPTTTQAVYTCSQSVTLTFGTNPPVTFTNTFTAISLDGSPVTSQTAGISCVVSK